MAKKQAKKEGLSQKLVSKAFHEVHTNPPSTLGTNQTKGERRKQEIAISLSKARSAGADIPANPKKKRASRAGY